MLNTVVKSSSKHFNVITSIIQYTLHLSIKISLKHVKGHQDDELEYSELDRPAQLNVQTDSLAKSRLTAEINHKQQNWDRPLAYLPLEPCKIFIKAGNGHLPQISWELEKTIYSNIASKQIKQYWILKDKFHDNDSNKLDCWDLMHKAFKSISNGQQNQISKWLTGFCGVGKSLVWYDHQSHSWCPRCNEENKDVQHVLQCNHDSAKALWDQELLKNWRNGWKQIMGTQIWFRLSSPIYKLGNLKAHIPIHTMIIQLSEKRSDIKIGLAGRVFWKGSMLRVGDLYYNNTC